MGTRGWTLSTFLGCCVWILHGLGAAAVPVTTEGPFTVGTAYPITAENEGPSALVTGTADRSTTAADAEIDESIFTRSPLSSTFPPGTETDSFVTATSEYGPTVPTWMNVTKPLNTSQGIEGVLAAPATDTTTAAITAQHPAVTPEAEYEVIEATPDPTLDITPDVKEDIPAAVTRGEEDIDLTTGNMPLPTTPPPADTWVPQPTAGSPVGVGVTVLPSQGLTTAMGAAEEVITLPASIQTGSNVKSSSPSPSAEELLTTQQGGVVSGIEGTNPEPAEEMAPAAEESPLASESGDAGEATNGEFSTAGSSHLPPESPVMSETEGSPGEPSLLPGQAVLSPDASLAPSTGYGDGKGVPGVSTEASGSALSPAASEAPVAPEETEDTATSLLAPEVPTDAQSHVNLPTLATVLSTGGMGTVGLNNPSLQPDPWQTPTGEQPPLLPDALTDTPSAPGAAYPPPGAEASTLPADDGAAETPSSPDLTTAPEAPMSPSLGESQQAGMPDGAPQETDGPGTGLSSDSDAPSPAPVVPDGLAWPTAGVQGQGAQGAEEMAQVGGSGDGSPYTDTQSDMSPSAPQPSASPANNGDLLIGGTGDLANAEQSPPSALGEGTGAAGGSPALGEVSSPGSAPPSSAGMEPDLSGAEGPVDLPSESASAPGAVYPLSGSVSGPASGAETPLSPDLSGAQGAPGSPSFGGSQPWGTAAGAPQGVGLPGAEGPDSGLSSPGDVPSSAVHGPVGPPSPAPGDQLGTNLGLPAAGGPGAGTAEQALEGAGSGIDSEPSLSSTTDSGIDQLPGEGASSGPASPSDVVAAPSVSRGDEAGPISGAVPGPDSLPPASPDSETGLVEEAESAGNVAQAGNPEIENPYLETSPSGFSPQQDPTNTGELLTGGTGDLANAEQSPPSALGEGTGAAGGSPALGEVSSPGSAPPSSAGMEPDLSGAEGPVDLPSESASAPGAVYPLPGSVSGPASGAETPLSPDLSGAQGAPGSPSFGGSQPWGTAAGAPQGAGLPGAEGPDSGLSSPGDVPSSAVHGPVGPPSPAPGDQLGTNLGLPAAGGPGAGTAEQALEGAGSGIDSEPSLSSATDSGMAAGIDQLPGEGASSGLASPSDVVAAPSVSRGDEAGPISSAVPGPDSQPPASLDSASAGDVAQAGNPESPYLETNPSAFSPQQDPTNTGELLTGGTGDLANAEQSPPSALGEGTGAAGGSPALGEVSSPGSAPPSSAGMEPDLSGAEGPVDLPSESASAPGAVYPLPGSVSGPASGAETPLSPDLSGAQGAPGSPSFGGSQPWGTAAGAPQGAGLPGAEGPDSGLSSPGDVPSSAVHGPVGPPSPAPGDQLGTNLGLPAAGGPGAGTAEQALEGAGSGIDSEPSLSSATDSGMAAGIDQLPGEGASSGLASPSDVVAAPSVSRGDEAGPISSAVPGPDSQPPASLDSASAGDVAQAGNPESPYLETNPSAFSPQEDQLPGAGSSSGPAPPSGEAIASSVSDPSSQSALGGVDNAPGALQPSLDAGPGVPAAAEEGASEVAGNGESMGQSQAPTGKGPAGSGTPDEEMGDVLQSASSSSSTEGSSLPGRTDEAVNEATLPGAGGADSGLNTGLEAAGPQEAPVSVPGIQSGANIGLSDGKQSQVDVVEVPGGASVNGGSSSSATLVPVAPNNSGVSGSTATSTAASLLLPEHGLSSGLAPNGDTHSAPGTQSGSRPLLPGAPSGLAGEPGDISWSLEDELTSGMPAPLGEASPHAPVSPNAAPVLPSAPQRGNAAEGVSVSPGLSTPLATRESIVGSSAGGKGELGASAPGAPVLLLPPCQTGSTGAPSRDADNPVPGKASAVLPGVMAGQENVAQLLPSVTGSGADTETPTHSPLHGSPGLPGLPPTGITAGSTGSKIPGAGPTGGSPSTALQPILDNELATSSANRAPATTGSSLPRASPGQGGSQGGSPGTACPGTSCSPAPADPAPRAPLLRGREVLPRLGTATVTSHTSSPVVPAPPEGPAAAPAPLPSPAVPAVPLYGYGARENDWEYVERRVDFNSPLFKPETGFPFGRTLRDSLYFTDNGQIIFPASDKGIFTYPNPPPGGFNGHEEVPMIAVFWDNADFSRGVGTTFYQEFSTLNTAKPPFVRDVEAKVRRYMRSSYSAAWTLKITWEKAPVYSSWTDPQKTITYQAVLTTDGFRSYILMLYQDGGMQWDYTRLATTNVLIGYTSGDGFYHNDDLSKRPPAAKYRPDQFRGYNTDLRGLWIYKLESRVGINYRLKCLAWTGQQQEPRTWSQGLPSCPCSLQQGQQDPRFKSSRGGRWAARVSMLHSASPNQHGAGVRCLYDSQNQLIEGRQERYWRSSRQASPYRDQELKLYDWCCNRAGSAHLCARYSEKRPKIGCDGYQSPGMDSSEEIDSDEEIDEDDK